MRALIAAATFSVLLAQTPAEDNKDPSNLPDSIRSKVAPMVREELREEIRKKLIEEEKYWRDRIAKETGGQPMGSTGAILLPALPSMNFRIVGKVVKRDPEGGIIIDLGKGQLITKSTGESFVAGGALFKIEGVSASGVTLSVEQRVLVD